MPHLATVRRVRERVYSSVRASPAVVPALLALAALVVIAESQGGYYPLDWYPAALFAFGLLLVALLAIPRAARVPRPILVAAGLLGAYAAWSYLTIAWADDQGAAWDGANTTVLYAVLFALFALWPLREAPAATLLGAFTLAITALGVRELLAIDPELEPGHSFVDGRLTAPIGYANGNAALWTMALVPALVFGVRRETPATLRPLFLASAGLLAGLALMGQSRGWLFVIGPAAIALVGVSAGGRSRTTVGIALVSLATVIIGGTLLDVREAYDGGGLGGAVDDARAALFVAAAALAVVGAAWALVDRRVRVSARGGRAAGSVVAAAVLLVAIAGLAAFSAREGSPVTALGDAWEDFKTEPTPVGGEGSRFAGGVGSNRYDFWRVAWAEFRDHPVAGIGVDNFQQPYLARGKSTERPRHPHSVPLRALSQTGVVGALLLVAALAAALLAAVGAIRRRSGLARVSASAATALFFYWVLHGAVDWFWELPALGGAAFAFLGLACSLAPRAEADGGGVPQRDPPGPLAAAWPAKVAVLAVAALAGVALARPWLAELYVERAARGWGDDRAQAFQNLDRASELNPLSATPVLIEGGIASRLELFERSADAYREALARDPRNAYAMLNLAVIEWQLGEKREAMGHMRATRRLDPRYVVAQEVERAMRKGELLDVNEVNREIARRANRLAGR
jgi:hypothetical protein